MPESYAHTLRTHNALLYCMVSIARLGLYAPSMPDPY